MLYNEKTTEVDVLSHFDIVERERKLLVLIDRVPLIDLVIGDSVSSADIDWEVTKAYNERFGKVND